jgi:hypothetical protein
MGAAILHLRARDDASFKEERRYALRSFAVEAI